MIFENVTKLCKDKGITVSALERELNLGNATIRGWEKSDPRVGTLKLVADYFGVSVDWIIGFDNSDPA